jgi:tetratricopeptide (TPR) repeat protein
VNPKYGKLFAQAAVGMELPEVAIMTLETVRDNNPEDISVLSWLGVFYQKVGRMRSARECFERLCELSPNDPAALKQLKDAMALDSMASDGWEKSAEKGGSFRDILKDGDEAALLEQGAKSAKSDSGLDSLVADMKRKIEAEPMNINYRRGLANLFLQKRDFESAITVLEAAVKMNPGDPELERAVTNAHLRQFESQAEALRNAGDEEGAVEMDSRRLQYKFDDLQNRVERYPNDLQLRFEWGVMLFENDYINEAIQQLQIAQRSAKNRVQALFYLGVCFRSKQQYDVACRQLETALAELPILDANKKKVLYELGELAELMGNPKKAAELFMQIYQDDISYRDVAERIEKAYQQSQ